MNSSSPKPPSPGRVRIYGPLDDLKDSLLGMIIIALAVLVLGAALTWDGTSAILEYPPGDKDQGSPLSRSMSG